LEEELSNYLLQYFLKPFQNKEYYHLSFSNDDHELNPVYHYSKELFERPDSFHIQSIHLAKHLFETALHPNILGGDFYVCAFDGMQYDGQMVKAIGLFKAEKPDHFLKLKRNGQNFDLDVESGIAIDKLDKIGLDGVIKELLERGFSEQDIEKLKPIILLSGTNEEKLASLRSVLSDSQAGLNGISEIERIFNYLEVLTNQTPLSVKQNLELDITLARGLNYYTGAIFEVKTNEVAMGSIGGGGRYDDLTGMFGLSDLTGVGISFGADRIYDVLEELNLFPESTSESTKVLLSNFDEQAELYALPLLQKLRTAGISAEIYPSSSKLKKQMTYADDKNIPFVILIGSDEMESGLLTLKNMKSGEQQKLSSEQIIEMLA
jgi:hypothetical protein